jgi:hypothetical protein
MRGNMKPYECFNLTDPRQSYVVLAKSTDEARTKLARSVNKNHHWSIHEITARQNRVIW